MNAKKLYNKRDDGTFIDTSVYYCTKCNRITGGGSEAAAEDCCQPPKPNVCKCGQLCTNGWLSCLSCRIAEDEKRWKAKPVVKYNGEPVEHDEHFYRDMYDMVDSILGDDSDRPESVELCDRLKVNQLVTVDDIIEYMREQCTENMEDGDLCFDGEDELRNVLQAFLDKQTFECWEVNGKRALVSWDAR